MTDWKSDSVWLLSSVTKQPWANAVVENVGHVWLSDPSASPKMKRSYIHAGQDDIINITVKVQIKIAWLHWWRTQVMTRMLGNLFSYIYGMNSLESYQCKKHAVGRYSYWWPSNTSVNNIRLSCRSTNPFTYKGIINIGWQTCQALPTSDEFHYYNRWVWIPSKINE